MAAVFSSAMSIKLLTADVDQLVPVVQAKAGFERRKVEDEEIGM